MTHRTPANYDKKFSGLIKLCQESKASGVKEIMVAAPFVLGDTYEELVESLLRISKAGLSLRIVPDTEVQRNN